MNDPKAAAAYHPGDAPVTRPDLDELIGRVYYAADWAFSSAPDALQEALWEAGAAIESERARADQAAAKVKAVEALLDKWMRDGEQPDLWIALNRALSAAPTAEQ